MTDCNSMWLTCGTLRQSNQSPTGWPCTSTCYHQPLKKKRKNKSRFLPFNNKTNKKNYNREIKKKWCLNRWRNSSRWQSTQNSLEITVTGTIVLFFFHFSDELLNVTNVFDSSDVVFFSSIAVAFSLAIFNTCATPRKYRFTRSNSRRVPFQNETS